MVPISVELIRFWKSLLASRSSSILTLSSWFTVVSSSLTDCSSSLLVSSSSAAERSSSLLACSSSFDALASSTCVSYCSITVRSWRWVRLSSSSSSCEAVSVGLVRCTVLSRSSAVASRSSKSTRK